MRYATFEQLNDGPEVELPYDSEFTPDLMQQIGDKWVIGYLAADRSGGDIDDMMGACMGVLYSFHRRAPREDREKGLTALGICEDEVIKPDPDAMLLDCYEHGQQYWSVHGEGMQCQWDTARGAGVWVPDKCLRGELASILDDKKRREKAIEFCRQFLEQYNAILEGDVWGVIVAWYDEDGEEIDHEAVWGYIGGKWAQESLNDSFKTTCEHLAKEKVAA